MYNNFAKIYDILMQEVPYEKWSLRISEWIKTYGISRPNVRAQENGSIEERHSAEKNLVLDLGCGTGTLTEILAGFSYDMIGIDNSPEMLNIAMEKKDKSGSSILYLCQNMQEMELYSTVGTIICVCDSLNYLLSHSELKKMFKLVKNYLYPGGIFIFDFNTVYKYEKVIGDSTIAENHEECAFIWENFYDSNDKLNEYDLTFFIKAENGCFERYQETHYQKGYELEQIRSLLTEAGLDIITAIDDETEKSPDEKSERVFVVARNTAF